MKKFYRFLCLLLATILLFSLEGCVSGENPDNTTGEYSDNTKNTTATEADPTEEKTPSGVKIPKVPNPLKKSEVAALPVASNSMSNEELRDLCVRFMEMQGSFQWTASADFHYQHASAAAADANGNLNFSKGVIYGGLPYTPASSNLYSMLDYYDDETGILDVSTLKTNFGSILGNDCADAVFWAWGRVSNSISYTLTHNMFPYNGCLKLGNYTYPDNITSWKDYYTRQVCEDNGKDTMYEAYALLRKADGVVCYNSGGGHAMMLAENAHVVRKADGSIDEKESYIVVMEQDSTLRPTTVDGVTVQVEGGIRNKYSFQKLFSQRGFLPIQIAELAGTKAIDKAAVSLDAADGSDLDAVIASKLKSNYRISKVIVTFTDADGKVAYEGFSYGKEATMYEMPMSSALRRATLSRSLKEGQEYTLTVSVLVSTGETLTAYTGAVTF